MSDTRNHTTRDQLAEHFRRRSNGIWADEIEEQHRHKDISPAHCNDFICRRAVEDADALLASDAIAAVRAAAVAETTAAIEALDFTSRRLGTATEDPWVEGWNYALEVCRADVRAALSGGRTALDTMLADAWDEGWEAAWSPMSMHNRDNGPNPYRADTGADQ